MDKDVLIAWIVLIIVWIIILFIFMTIGSLAKKRGRSFWGWTLIPFLIPLFIVLIPIIGKVDGTPIGFLIIPFGITYPIGLLTVLLSGKTKEKRMQEIYEEEQWRKMMRD